MAGCERLPRRVRRCWVVLGLALLAATGACAENLTVFAAASLTDAFRTIGKEFDAAHPGTKVEFNFAGSSTLARQIIEGAPADVFASADEENMKKAVDAGDVAGKPQTFARNRLAIVVPHGNPKRVAGLADLGRAGMTVALAASEVPVGRYATQAFAKAGVPRPEASSEVDVKAVLTRVAMGEADAGVVYATDMTAGGDRVEAVTIPDAHNVIASYPIATLKSAPNAAGARAFVDYVLSAAGQGVLQRSGFIAP